VTRPPSPLRALLACLVACLATLPLAACGTPGRNVPVELPAAPEPLASRLIAREVGRLLSASPEESSRAERRLTALDEDGRAALRVHAATIPGERDPRWLNVLDENHALGPLPPDVELEYLLWKASREESFYVMKAQSRLLDLARSQPDLLIARMARGGRGAEALAVALALADERRAIPPLLARYENARSLEERRVAAEALARLVGDDLRPRLQGSDAELRRDADAIRGWLAANPEETVK
jgi:hypothetical protein